MKSNDVALKRADGPETVMRRDEKRPSIDQVLQQVSKIAGQVAVKMDGCKQTPDSVSQGLYSYLRRQPAQQLRTLLDAWEQQPGAFMAAVMHIVALRLPLGVPGTWALVCYKRRGGGWDITPIVMQHGARALIERRGYRDVRVHLVREGEVFEEEIGVEPVLRYIPKRPQDVSASIKCALITYRDREGRGHVVVDGARLRRVEQYAAKNRGPWVDWRDEMIVKTAILSWYKQLPREPDDGADALQAIEVGEAGGRQVAPVVRAVIQQEEYELPEDAAPEERAEESTEAVTR